MLTSEITFYCHMQFTGERNHSCGGDQHPMVLNSITTLQFSTVAIEGRYDITLVSQCVPHLILCSYDLILHLYTYLHFSPLPTMPHTVWKIWYILTFYKNIKLFMIMNKKMYYYCKPLKIGDKNVKQSIHINRYDLFQLVLLTGQVQIDFFFNKNKWASLEVFPVFLNPSSLQNTRCM